MHGTVRDLVEESEHYKAVKAAEKWYHGFADMGAITRTTESRELT